MKLSAPLRPGLHVLVVPTEWKIAAGPHGYGDTPAEVCLHVACQLFGSGARIWEPETEVEGEELYDIAFKAVESACVASERDFEVTDRAEGIIRLGGRSWREAGYRWIRIVEVPDETNR